MRVAKSLVCFFFSFVRFFDWKFYWFYIVKKRERMYICCILNEREKEWKKNWIFVRIWYLYNMQSIAIQIEMLVENRLDTCSRLYIFNLPMFVNNWFQWKLPTMTTPLQCGYSKWWWLSMLTWFGFFPKTLKCKIC